MVAIIVILVLMVIFIFFAVINIALDNSRNTKLLEENHKVLTEIVQLLKIQNKDS